jgi:hypothetical protein
MQASPYSCSACGAALAMDDVNVSADVGLCRACGRSGSFLMESSVPVLSDEEIARPPKRISLHRDFGDALSIVVRPKKGLLLFLLPFTAFWSGGSMAGIYVVPLLRGEFDWKAGLFGLPFLLGTVLLVSIILYLLFGKTTVTLKKGLVTLHTGVFGRGRTKELVCEKGTVVTLEPSSYRVNNVRQSEVVVSSGGKQLRFGAASLSDEGKRYVAGVLRRAASGR